MFKQKLTASLIHFLISLGIFSFFIAVLIFSWFPEPFFTASGGWQGLKLVALVDLVLGPLLTFVIYNQCKPKHELKRDIGIIVLLQLSALIWGIYTVYLQRPVAIVFWENQFITVPAIEISDTYFNTKTYIQIKQKPRQFYIAKKPTSISDINAMLDRLNKHQLGPYQQLELYQKLENSPINLQKFSLNIQKITQHNKGMLKQLNTILRDKALNSDELLYLPLESKYQNIVLIFNREQQYIAYIKAPLKKQDDL